MPSIYLSAGKNKFFFNGTQVLPVSSIKDHISAAFTPRDFPSVWKSYKADIDFGSFYYFEPGKEYSVHVLSSFNFNFE